MLLEEYLLLLELSEGLSFMKPQFPPTTTPNI